MQMKQKVIKFPSPFDSHHQNVVKIPLRIYLLIMSAHPSEDGMQ